jgi:hypothetical protein
MQGYIFSRPIPARDVLPFLAGRRGRDSKASAA